MSDQNEPVQFKLMLPAKLKDRVATAAQHNRRSLSQEIVATLEDAYPAPFGREEGKKMIKALLVMHDNRRGTTEEEFKRTLRFAVAVLQHVWGEDDPESALLDIEKEDIDIKDVMMLRFAQWQDEMKAKIALSLVQVGKAYEP